MSISAAFREHLLIVADAARTLPLVLDEVVRRIDGSLRSGGKILVCGNGGSAADAQHFVAELVGRFARDRAAIPAVALTADTSALTAIANDHGFDSVFGRQVEALAREGDAVVLISTSGRSRNVLAAARRARDRGCVVIGLTSGDGGELGPLCDVAVLAPAAPVARVQEVHALCLHAIAAAIEDGLPGGAA